MKGREQDAVIADSQPEPACECARESLYIAMPGLRITEEPIEDEHGRSEEIAAGTNGRSTQYGAADNVSQRFTGQERDDTGLDFFQARYYSSSLGRFTSPDPDQAGVDLTDPQSWIGYAYVGTPFKRVYSIGFKG